MIHVAGLAICKLGADSNVILSKRLPEVLGAAAVQKIMERLGRDRYSPTTILSCEVPLIPMTHFDVSAHRIDGLLCVDIEPAAEERRWDLLSTRLEHAIRELGGPTTLEWLYATVPQLIRRMTPWVPLTTVSIFLWI